MNYSLLTQIRESRKALGELIYKAPHNDEEVNTINKLIDTIETQVLRKTPALLRQKEGVS